jgi:hypothetical protein
MPAALAIPDSTCKIYPGMGHELPRPLWPDFVTAITTNAGRAEKLS